MTKEEYLTYLSQRLQNQDKRNLFIETGLGDLNYYFNENSFSKLVLISGRIGMGIDALLVTIIANVAFHKKKPLCLITEVNSGKRYFRMLLGHLSNVSIHDVFKQNLNDQDKNKLLDNLESIDNSPFYIQENSLTIQNIWIAVSHEIQQHRTSIFIIPDIEEISGFKNQKSTIVKSLKEICQTLNVMIITGFYLSNKVELQGGDMRPGYYFVPKKIRMHCDLILLLYRAEYYKINEDENGESTRGKAEVIVATKSYPCSITFQFKYIFKLARFKPIDQQL